jgi:hypothetical protein
VQALAKRSPPSVDLSPEQCDRIAALALALSQEGQRKSGLVLTGWEAMPYEDRPVEQRAAMRRGVVRLIEALKLLEYIE